MIRLHTKSSGSKPSIQISPMIDMVFLLLVFFVVCTMYMNVQKGAKVDLPESAGEVQQQAPIAVTVAKDGRIYYQNQEVTVPQLVEKARQAAKENPKQTVTLQGDKGVSYGRVMGVLGELKKAGLTDFSLAVDAGEHHG